MRNFSFWLLRSLRENSGFSLIEILIVLSIIGILLTIAIPNLFKAEESARKRATEIEMRGVISSLYTYRLANYSLPKSLEDLISEGYIKKEALEDEWGTKYQYSITGNTVILKSAGADKKLNTKDDITMIEKF